MQFQHETSPYPHDSRQQTSRQAHLLIVASASNYIFQCQEYSNDTTEIRSSRGKPLIILRFFKMNNQRSHSSAGGMQDRRGLLQDFDAPASEAGKIWRAADMEGGSEHRWRRWLGALHGYKWFITTGLLVIIFGFQLVIWSRIGGTSGCSRQVGGNHMDESQSCSSRRHITYQP
jgi:hypothetical protein